MLPATVLWTLHYIHYWLLHSASMPVDSELLEILLTLHSALLTTNPWTLPYVSLTFALLTTDPSTLSYHVSMLYGRSPSLQGCLPYLLQKSHYSSPQGNMLTHNYLLNDLCSCHLSYIIFYLEKFGLVPTLPAHTAAWEEGCTSENHVMTAWSISQRHNEKPDENSHIQ